MPTLNENILTAQQALLARITALASTSDPQALVLAAKALEALRGSVSLQSVIESGELAIANIATSLGAATTSLGEVEDDHAVSLNALKLVLAGNLNTLATDLTDSYLGGANAIGNPRIGDIWLAMYPNPAALPANVVKCDGTYLAVADMDLLRVAWGLNVGGTVCPFVVNYNASVAGGDQVIVDGSGLRLPNFSGGYFKASNPSTVGAKTTYTVAPTGSTIVNFAAMALVRYK